MSMLIHALTNVNLSPIKWTSGLNNNIIFIINIKTPIVRTQKNNMANKTTNLKAISI